MVRIAFLLCLISISVLLDSTFCFVPSSIPSSRRFHHHGKAGYRSFALQQKRLYSTAQQQEPQTTSSTRFTKKKNPKTEALTPHRPVDRFQRTASSIAQIDEPCILTIDGQRYNLTAWAQAHPGGAKILQKFHNKDATRAFDAAGHSTAAYEMLKDFVIVENDSVEPATMVAPTTVSLTTTEENTKPKIPRWRAKLFTQEDPIGIHKYMGIFCLLHFIFRFGHMYFGDPSSGFGTRRGKGPSWLPVLCLVPHAVLSLSSLIFHTVPKERVVGKPMIWQEFRVHNIVFGLRSVITTALCSMAIHGGQSRRIRRIAVVASCVTVLLAQIGADLGTHFLRANTQESTTATMPYWDGCSLDTQKRFKSFYAYSQFMATLGCVACTNPAFPFSVMLAIQLASLLMTLVRKGLLSAKGYHILYTASLIAPYGVGIRSSIVMGSPEFATYMALGYGLYQGRRHGINKYALWLPVLLARIWIGDSYINWHVW